MADKEYANGIYIKKFTNQYGDWIALTIKKDNGEYESYKFYPKKEQKSDKYVEFYGVKDNWKPTKKQSDELIGEEEIPF